MSYCRFSTDDYQCDLYVYANTDGGFSVHVAGGRYVFDTPLPEPVREPDGSDFDTDLRRWCERYEYVHELVKRAAVMPIGLSRDGRSYHVRTAEQCVALVKSLAAEGYRVPDYVAPEIREDARRERYENRIHEILAGTYTPEGIGIWLDAKNAMLSGSSPRETIAGGDGEVVLRCAERVAGGQWA